LAAAPKPRAERDTTLDTESVSAEKADGVPAADDSQGHKNTVRQLVEEITNLMADTHEIREDVRARGVQFHTLNMMIEMGVHDKPDEQAEVMKTAIAASKKAHGGAAITEAQLRSQLDTIVMLERDIGHVRRLAQEQKLNMQAMNFLTQIIRSNPGDGGKKVVNEFVAYAMLCGIEIEKFKEVIDNIGSGPKSVLPVVELPEEDPSVVARKKLFAEIALGLAIGVSVFWVFL